MLEKIDSPKDIKVLDFDELNILAGEIREYIIEVVSKNGGHLASNLGAVELTLALHKVYDMPKDSIIWDVGHQTYTHKIITGRREEFKTLRTYNGISGFPKYKESIYDSFETGHSSTSISAALGIAKANEIIGNHGKSICVIGDGALTGGMALEALNHAGELKTDITVILNDNDMSIEKNVGGISKYLSKIRIEPEYQRAKEDINELIGKIPAVGSGINKVIEKAKEGIKTIATDGILFEEIGFTYLGPVDGHNIEELSTIMGKAKNLKGPVLIHVITKKGKGYSFAEETPENYHSISPFNIENGQVLKSSKMNYSKCFGNKITKLAETNDKIVCVTAAMTSGTGLDEFREKYSDRILDAGIAEQHAVTLAAGLARRGIRPYVAIYATFMQRAYDQVIHDVALGNLPVTFLFDRAGIVGADGETHQGIFDVSIYNTVPNIKIFQPRCYKELNDMLDYSLTCESPLIIRYPRGGEEKIVDYKYNGFDVKWDILDYGSEITIISNGNMLKVADEVKNKLSDLNMKAELVNARIIKPLDIDYIKDAVKANKNIVVIEDNIKSGSLGDMIICAVLSLDSKYNKRILTYTAGDDFMPHGSIEKLLERSGIDSESIFKDIKEKLKLKLK